ncbi:hypothetical protein DFS34DRAFT_227660 [Phlyctochytrium arcticum]|nr:hypothetical protein DFS34DRAFT_227660 [Phlyctochytrium arcticum]
MTCLRKFRLEDILLYRWEGGHEKYDQYSEAFDKEEAHAAIRRENDAAIIEEGDSTENLALVGDTPGQYWFGHAHANTSGRVTGVASTFDDSFFTTAGTDGGLFVWRVTMEDIKSSEAFEGPEALEFEDGGADDIVDPSAYSLQQAKIEMERDKEFEDAENKKQVTRDDIQELRNEFVKLVNENERLVGGDQIPRPAMTIDPDLRSDIEKETEEKILSVRRELEWSSQKESVVPDKLQRTFLDVLQTGRIQIKAFQVRNKHSHARGTT